jgi:HlyD family secretion protein
MLRRFKSKPLQTFLTVVQVLLGSFAMTLALSAYLTPDDSSSEDTFLLQAGYWEPDGSTGQFYNIFLPEDFPELLQLTDDVETIAISSGADGTEAIYNGERFRFMLGVNVTPNYLEIANLRITKGSAFTNADEESQEALVVMSEIADAEKEVQTAQLNLNKLRLEQDNAARQETVDLEIAQTVLKNAEAELNTTQQLFDVGNVFQNDLTAAEQKVAQARGDVENKTLSQQNAVSARALSIQEAQLELEQAQSKQTNVSEQQTQLTLTAPVTGRVMKLSVTVGQAVTAQTLLATVASSQDVRVVAKLPEAQASRLSVGQVANLKIADTTYQGSVVQISPNAESGQNGPVVPVTLGFDAVPEGICIGASISVEIEVGRKDDALFLPRGAYLSTGGERFVYLVVGDTATRTEIMFGLVDGNNVEVREGLQLGDKVIISSYEALQL